jgi:hypothetical protein
MPIPSYKQIHIKSEAREMIYDQLNFHQFGQVPYILSISHLENEIEALKNIEDYCEEHRLSNYPYPLYVVSTLQNYRGALEIFESIEQCPKFYKQKIKQLNVKENKILQKIYLKQKNLMNMRNLEYRPYLEEYGRSHKKLHTLYQEEVYLNKLAQKLEAYYDKKES